MDNRTKIGSRERYTTFSNIFTLTLLSKIQVIDNSKAVDDEDSERETFNTLFEMCPVVRFTSHAGEEIVYVVQDITNT